MVFKRGTNWKLLESNSPLKKEVPVTFLTEKIKLFASKNSTF